MPNPPNQWVMLRQNKILKGRLSISSMTVAPVPVKPEMLSNTPSMRFRYPPVTYGIIPRKVAKSQPRPVMAMPSRMVRCLVLTLPYRRRRIPQAIMLPMAMIKAPVHSSPKPSARSSGTQVTPDSAIDILPKNRQTTRKSITTPFSFLFCPTSCYAARKTA